MLELLLKYPPERYLAGHLELAVSWVGYAGLCALVLVGAWWGLRYVRAAVGGQRLALMLSRSGLLALLAFILLDPRLVTPASERGDGAVALLLDDSRSMALADAEGRVRGERMLADLGPGRGTVAAALAARFDTVHLRMGVLPGPLVAGQGLGFDAGFANLGAALEAVLAGATPPAAVVVASDGGVSADARSAQALLALRAAGVMVHVVHYGGAPPGPDVALSALRVPARSLLGDSVPIGVELTHAGLAGSRARLRLEEDGLLIEAREVALAAQGPTLASFEYRPDAPGVQRLVVRAEVALEGGEALLANNRQERLLQVEDRRLDVLHYEAEPRFEVKFARRALSADGNVQLVSLVRTAENKFYRLGVSSAEELADGFPRDEAVLFDYEMVVLGSVGADDLDAEQQRLLVEFVSRRGGALLLLGGARALAEGGQHASALAPLLPVRLGEPASGFRDQVQVLGTRLAERHALAGLAAGGAQWTAFAELPPLSVVNPVRAARPGAQVLLRGISVRDPAQSYVVLAEHRYGRGQVAVLPVRDTWRWQMHSSIAVADQTHELLWRRMVRWLAGAAPQRLNVQLVPDRAAPGETVNVEVQALDEGFRARETPRLQLTMAVPGGQAGALPVRWERLDGGRHRATVVAPTTGPVRFEVRDLAADTDLLAQAHLSVQAAGREFDDVLGGREAAAALAVAGGGQLFEAARVNELVDAIEPRTVSLAGRERLPIWNAPLLLIAALLLACLEWAGRRRWGLA